MGWYDYNARWYDPAVGRMMQVDPLAVVSQSLSSYHYANNNPVRFVDPTGMTSEPFEWQQGVDYEALSSKFWRKVGGDRFSPPSTDTGHPDDPGVKAHHVARAISSSKSSASNTSSGSEPGFWKSMMGVVNYFAGRWAEMFGGEEPGYPTDVSQGALKSGIRGFVDITQSFNFLYSGISGYAGISSGLDLGGNGATGFSNSMWRPE